MISWACDLLACCGYVSLKNIFSPIFDLKNIFPHFWLSVKYENFISVMETLLMQVSRYARDNYAFETAECC